MNRFVSHTEQAFLRAMERIPDFRNRRYLVAVSGGLDSMVLTDLMARHGLLFDMAHCHFGLRGAESDEDEAFVRRAAAQYGVRAHIRRCPVTEGNVQVEARRKRYAYFDELRRQYGYDYILTAHHADDQIETFFINLLRGSGIKGLTGIGETGSVKRPLREVFRDDLEAYARHRQLAWREDSSNRSDKYLRNRIRHRLVPLLEEWEPAVKAHLMRSMRHLQQSYAAEEAWFAQTLSAIKTVKDHTERIEWEKLPQGLLGELFLYKWLTPLGFTDMKAVRDLIRQQKPGVLYNNARNKVLFIRDGQIILETVPEETADEYRWQPGHEIPEDWPFTAETMFIEQALREDFRHAPPHICYLDKDKLSFPVVFRRWRPGDRFMPLGMKGFKKVGDFLTDLKMPLHQRKQVYVLESDGEIACVAGLRPDQRFALDERSTFAVRFNFKAPFLPHD